MTDNELDALYDAVQLARAARAAGERMVRAARHELQRARVIGLAGVPAAEHMVTALEAQLYSLVGDEDAAVERLRRALESEAA